MWEKSVLNIFGLRTAQGSLLYWSLIVTNNCFPDYVRVSGARISILICKSIFQFLSYKRFKISCFLIQKAVDEALVKV